MEKKANTYVSPDGRDGPPLRVSWRWFRVPAVLWLIVVGSSLTALALLGRVGYLLARQGPIQPGDDFNLTVFILLLSGAGTVVFSFVVFMLAQPEEPASE